MKKIYVMFSLVATSIFMFSHTSSLSPNGKAGYTTATRNCSSCHGGAGSGSMNLTSNIPASGFVPGATYTMTLSVAQTGQPAFGMDLAAIGGTLTPGSGTKILTGELVQSTPSSTGNFTFSWTAPTTGNATFNYAGLAANGNGVDDAGDNTYTGTKTFTPQVAATPITATASASNVTCFGSSDGTATVTPSGGTTYTYLWSNGQTTQTATNLTAGTYSVVVTSGTQTASASATVSQPAQLSMPTMSILNNVCPSLSGTISASGCGAGTVVEYATSATGTYSTTAPSYTTSPITVYARCRNTTTNCTSPSASATTAPITCITCPTLAAAPANVTIVNSTCSSACTVSGGSISAPTAASPAGASLQYSVNGGAWSTTLPTYSATAQSIQTRYVCNTDATIFSPTSAAMSTVPANCGTAPDMPTISIVNNICPSLTGTISASGCGVGTVLEYATSAAGPYSTTAPVYTASAITVYARCRNTTTNCVSTSASATTVPLTCGAICSTLTTAPTNVTVVNSTCGASCTATGGSISAPANACPTGSTLQYSINGGAWISSVPTYDINGAVQSIRTRCSCDGDLAITSPISTPVVTQPGTCTGATTAPTLVIVNNVPPSLVGTISATGCGAGTVVEYATSATGPYLTTAPTYTSFPITVYARCRNTTTHCTSVAVSGTTTPVPVTSTSTINLNCPADITVIVGSDKKIKVKYAITGSTTCSVGTKIILKRTKGLASNAAFSVGTNNICYTATDDCGNTKSCCFKIIVKKAGNEDDKDKEGDIENNKTEGKEIKYINTESDGSFSLNQENSDTKGEHLAGLQAKSVLLYPNPANDLLNVELSAFKGQTATIQILNQIGKIVSVKEVGEVTDGLISLDLQGIANGFYYLTVFSNGEHISNKFVIHK
jgi:Secretion system C-terminal sorting domain/SprB repeat/HYR domain